MALLDASTAEGRAAWAKNVVRMKAEIADQQNSNNLNSVSKQQGGLERFRKYSNTWSYVCFRSRTSSCYCVIPLNIVSGGAIGLPSNTELQKTFANSANKAYQEASLVHNVTRQVFFYHMMEQFSKLTGIPKEILGYPNIPNESNSTSLPIHNTSITKTVGRI